MPRFGTRITHIVNTLLWDQYKNHQYKSVLVITRILQRVADGLVMDCLHAFLAKVEGSLILFWLHFTVVFSKKQFVLTILLFNVLWKYVDLNNESISGTIFHDNNRVGFITQVEVGRACNLVHPGTTPACTPHRTLPYPLALIARYMSKVPTSCSPGRVTSWKPPCTSHSRLALQLGRACLRMRCLIDYNPLQPYTTLCRVTSWPTSTFLTPFHCRSSPRPRSISSTPAPLYHR